MARYVQRSPALRKRREALAARIRRINEYLRRDECSRAWLEYIDPIADADLDRYGVAFKQSTRKALRKKIRACERRVGR